MKCFYLIILSSVLISCGGGSSGESGYASEEVIYEELSTAPVSRQTSLQDQEPIEPITKKIIKSGGIEFESKAIEEDYERIKNLLPKLGGYIENENQNNTTQRISYNLTLRIPAEGYDSLYTAIAALAYQLENKYSNVDDVTGRYYDLKSRIKNKKALELRYLDLLKKAVTIKDILEIERELNEIRTQVEQLEGQFKFLNKQISYSTIQVTFYEVLPYAYDGSSRKGFGARILNALGNGWQGFLTFLVGILTLWPFFIIIPIAIWGFKRLSNHFKKKKKE